MTSILIWRLLKFVALLLMAGGTAGAFWPENEAARKRAVYGLGTAGLALTWIAGYGLLRAGGWSMRAPWIGGSIGLSLVWFQVLVWCVERPERRRGLWAAASIAALLGALVLMVFRPG